jgi:hypothetical protein
MANQSVPTHVISGAVALKGNAFPEPLSQENFGGFAPNIGFINGATGGTIDANDGLTFAISNNTSGAVQDVILPNAGTAMDNRIYTFYVVKPTGGGSQMNFKTVTGGDITGGAAASTQTAAGGQAVVYVIYASGAVQGIVTG